MPNFFDNFKRRVSEIIAKKLASACLPIVNACFARFQRRDNRTPYTRTSLQPILPKRARKFSLFGDFSRSTSCLFNTIQIYLPVDENFHFVFAP